MSVTIKSKEQLLGTWVRRIKNNTDITDFQAGGALVTLMEAIAQQVYQAQLSVLKVLEVTEVDNLTDKRLDDLAESLKIPNGQGGIGRTSALQATGSVVISSGFKKVSTRAYAGKPAPYAASKVLYVQDASGMPPSGQIYIGRNTIDTFEGPISYSSVSFTGTYWIISLVDPLTKDHPYTDEITLAQGGDRLINASTVVQVPAYSDSIAIQFTTEQSVTLADGEDSVTVSVTCTQYGVVGNVASGAITEFVSAPFDGATVANNQAFVNGSDTESDASLRLRIKDYPNTLARGTVGAINSALLTVMDTETKKRITSASVIRPLEQGEPTTVYVDDGTVLEPVFAGQDYELLLAKASGLEQSFKTAQAPITPATIIGTQPAPYVLQSGMTLTVTIDNIPYVYNITPSNYKDITAATAYEVVRDLNSDAEGILDFRVTENGKKIVAIDRTNAAEEIKVSAGELQNILGFSTVGQRPIYLYKNGVLQSFKGKTATISTNLFSNWAAATSYTGLQVRVDGVLVNVGTIQDSDFVAIGASISTASVENWRQVLQSKIPGVTVIFQDNRFVISSNKENSSLSEITIVDGTWKDSGSIFSTALSERSSVGASKDYTFNRYTGDIRFVSRLEAGDIIEIASLNTRGFAKSLSTDTGKYDLSEDYPGFGPAKFLIAVDDSVVAKVTGSIVNGKIKVTAKDSSNLTVSLNDSIGNGLFINAEIDDYIYLTAVKQTSTTPIAGFSNIPDSAVGFYRIKKIIRSSGDNKDTIIIEVSPDQESSFILNTEYDASYKGKPVFSIFSSKTTPQLVVLPNSASVTVENVVSSINQQVVGAEAERNTGQYFFLRTNTYVDGALSIISTFGKANNLFDASVETNLQAHIGSAVSGEIDGGVPIITETVVPSTPADGRAFREYLKIQKNFTEITQTLENPLIQADSTITSYPIGYQEVWATGKLAGWTGRVYNNETTVPFAGFLRTDSAIRPIGAISTTTQTINKYSNISFRLQDLSVTPYDKFVVEMDLDTSNKTITLPMYKKAVISSEVLTGISGKGQKYQFTLKDPEDFDKEFFEATSPFKEFDLNDFKIVGKSVGVYKLNSGGSGPNEPSLVVRSSSFGGTNRIKLCVLYPQSASQSDIKINHFNSYSSEEVGTTVNIEMPSNAALPPTIMDSGTYKVTALSTTNNLTDITLSSKVDAITSKALIQLNPPALNLEVLARASNYPGTLGNNIEFVIRDSGKLGATAGTVSLIAESTKKVIIDLYGSAPNAATLTTALNTSTYLQTVSGTGNLSLISTAYSYVPEAAASIANTGFTLTLNQIDYSPRIRGASGNIWSFQCTNSGTGTILVSLTGTAITVNLRGNNLLLSDLQTTLNSLPAINGAITVTVNTPSAYLLPNPSPIFFTGGVTASNTVFTASGADELSGIFANYSVNNLVQVSGVQSSTSMPIGVWPIVLKPTVSEIKIRVPNYSGLSTAVAVNSTFDASVYRLQSFSIKPKTLQDLVDAINAYLPDSPVLTAQALAVNPSTVDALIPVVGQFPRSTYINYTNTNTLPSTITTPSDALKFHVFSCNRSEGASIYTYGPSVIESVVQSSDAIFPTGTAISNTTYSSVGEEVYLLPTNTATLARWAGFSPASSLPIQANINRAEQASRVQISSKIRGTDGAVYVKDTLTNDYLATIIDAASAENNSAYFPVLTAQTRQLPKNSLVKITNAVTADLLRPFRVASSGASITTANTANEKTWVRTGANIIYQKVTSTRGRLYFLRYGQGLTVDGVGPTASEPLPTSSSITITANTPASGFATVSCSTGVLSARIGDMMYIKENSGLSSTVKCSAVPTGFSMGSNVYTNSHDLTGYPGYPVVHVVSSTQIVIAAPNITSNVSGTTASTTDLVFVPTLFTEKNIKTNYVAGPKGVEIVDASGLSGTAATPISGVYMYAVLKKLSNGFSALVVSNTSDGTNPPTAANDTLQLNECVVNTDDYVFLNGFGAGADGKYQLVAHDGKNTLILYNLTLPLEDILYDTEVSGSDVGKTWWGKKISINTTGFTLDPRPVRIVDSESVLVGSKIKISSAAINTTNWFPESLVGVWTISTIGFYRLSSSDSICQYIEFEIPNGAPLATQLITVMAANEGGISFVEKEPFSAFRLVQGWSIDPKNSENSQVYLTPSKSYQKISESLGTQIQCIGKLGYDPTPQTGVDGYKIFSGLVREAQRTLDGVPTSLSRYPGIKSTGTDVSVLPPIPRAISATLRIRTRDGLSVNVVADIIRSSVTSFVSSLGLGNAVILSELISVVQDIPGVTSVEIIETLPLAVDGKIPVADNEKAVIIDPETDINVGQ